MCTSAKARTRRSHRTSCKPSRARSRTLFGGSFTTTTTTRAGSAAKGLFDRNQKVFNDPPFQQPWQQQNGQTGWKLGDGTPGHRDFDFDNSTGTSTLYFDSGRNPNKHSLTDWLAYDVVDSQIRSDADTYNSPGYEPAALNHVSDVKLDLYYQRRGGEGPLRVQLTKQNITFEAQLLPGKAVLLMEGQPIGQAPLPVGGAPLHVQMMNVDYQVTLRVNGADVIQTTPNQYHPDMDVLLAAYKHNTRQDKPAVRLIGERQQATLSHVSLWRDVYYLNHEPPRSGPIIWATPGNPVHLGDGEFFVMGDNSSVSWDARYWNDPIHLPHEGLDVQSGRVPQRFMLGKAFFVYWPAGYRPIDPAPALVPNFGDMRFIH